MLHLIANFVLCVEGIFGKAVTGSTHLVMDYKKLHEDFVLMGFIDMAHFSDYPTIVFVS